MATRTPRVRLREARARAARYQAQLNQAQRDGRQAIADMYAQGDTSYRKLGAEVGLTGSRVQQIVEEFRTS